MNDTTPEIAIRVREMMMQRTGEERFVMGARMFDAARELVIASMPKDLPPDEFKRKLFERIYGTTIEAVVKTSHEP
jgi:hypothetical protein